MTIEEAKRRAELYSALAEGKTIQVLIKDDEWKDIKIDELKHLQDYYKYRIKPEPKYRPFKSLEECWREMKKHKPFGWIVRYSNNEYLHIGRIYNKGLNNGYIVTLKRIDGLNINLDAMFKIFRFDDGTPFGIKEE